MNKNLNKFGKRGGAVAIIVVMMIGAIVVEFGLAGLLLMYFTEQSSLGTKLSDEAFLAARSGIHDAMIKIIRDRNFSSPSGYTLSVDSKSAQVVVCRDTRSSNFPTSVCDVSNPGKNEIISTGTSVNKSRRLKAVIGVNGYSGEISTESLIEISL